MTEREIKRAGRQKKWRTKNNKKTSQRKAEKRSGSLQFSKGQMRQPTVAEDPLWNSGVAKMMCEPVISRHAQSLKLWHLA